MQLRHRYNVCRDKSALHCLQCVSVLCIVTFAHTLYYDPDASFTRGIIEKVNSDSISRHFTLIHFCLSNVILSESCQRVFTTHSKHFHCLYDTVCFVMDRAHVRAFVGSVSLARLCYVGRVFPNSSKPTELFRCHQWWNVFRMRILTVFVTVIRL